MAILTDDLEVQEKEGIVIALPVAVDIIYRGAMVKHNAAGFAEPCAAEAGSVFAGIAEEQIDNSGGSAGDLNVKVITEGSFLLTASGMAQTDVGVVIYATDDQLATKTEAANLQVVGRMVAFESATRIWVKLGHEGVVLGS